MRVSGMSTAFCVYPSNTAGIGPTPAGTAGLRHKQRHKTTHGSGPPPVPSARIAKPPVRQRGKAAFLRLGSQTPDLRNDGCNLIREQRRRTVRGDLHPAPQPSLSVLRKKPGDRLKTDRRDALKVARSHRSGWKKRQNRGKRKS